MIKKEGNAKLMDAVAQDMTFQKRSRLNFANAAQHNILHQLVKPLKDQGPGADKIGHDHSIHDADSASSSTAPQTSHISQTVGK